jgi:UDPglucose 6-dehydrogenase
MIPYLIKKGAKIKYYDPTGKKVEFDKLKNVQFKNNIKDACKLSDLVIIHTEWNEFKLIDLKKLVKKKNFTVYDMRNIYSPDKMIKQNIKYFGIGR